MSGGEEEEVEGASGEEVETSDSDSDIFVDAVENPSPVIASPSVSIPAPEGDPPGELTQTPQIPVVELCVCVCVCADVEEDTEYNEQDNTAGCTPSLTTYTH